MIDINKLSYNYNNSQAKKNNPQIAFKGHDIKDGNFKFFVPANKNASGTVNYVNADGSGKVESKKMEFKNGMLVADVPMVTADQALAYNFTVNGKTQVDLTQQKDINGSKFALTKNPNIVDFNRPHNIYHVLPDSFNPDEAKTKDKNGNSLWRNHFDLYGGNIDGVIEKLDEIKSLGAGRIMGTPIFGHDTLSNHGYWTENPYQIAPRMGNMDKFDKLNVEVFKRGMAWIADGAFVNQGLKGVQFQDVLRRTAKGNDSSPFLNWFTLYDNMGQKNSIDNPTRNFVLGLLPQDKEGFVDEAGFDIAFENAPYNRDGSENKEFDASKPSYLVLHEPRDSRQDAGVHISFDSVQNYKLPVNPEEVKEKFELWGTPDKSELLEWSNFTLDTADYDSQKQLWNGNRDVLKMNMKNPLVREYIMGAGEFWTTRVDNTLISYISENINAKLAGKAPSATNVKAAIDSLEKEGVLPQGSKLDIAEVQRAIGDEKIAVLGNAMTLSDAVAGYPIEAVEFPNEVLGIVTNPDFKDKLAQLHKNEVSEVISNIVNSSNLSEENKDKLQRPEVLRLVSQDLAKSILVKAVSGLDVMPGEEAANLKEATFNNLPSSIISAGSDVAVDSLIRNMKASLESIDVDAIAANLNEKVENYCADTSRVAKAILNKMEAGLDWRIDAAKDVADLDAVATGDLKEEEAMKFAKEFWNEFGERVRNINPNVYIIGEVTADEKVLPEFISENGFSTVSNYRYMWGQPYRFVHSHPEPTYGWNYGPTGFFNDLEEFVKAWPITAVNSAHNMSDNHDKAMVLSNLLMHAGDFTDETKGPQYSMEAVLNHSLANASKLSAKKDVNIIEAAKKADPVVNVINEAISNVSKEAGEQFGFWPLPRVFEAVHAKAADMIAKGESKANLGNVETRLNDMSKVLFNEMTDKYIRMLYLMVGAPGAPEIYNGTELGLTGGESNKINNGFIQNRNPIPWVWLDAKNGKPEVIEFNKKVKALFNMRHNKNLQVLNNGFVKDLGVKDDKNGVLAFMRYNGNQQALVVLNNGSPDPSSNAANYKKGDLKGNLAVTQKAQNNYMLDLKDSGIDIGTVFVNAENSNDKYVVGTDSKLHSMSEQGKGIDLEKGMILYRENSAAVSNSDKQKKSLNKIV